MTKEEYSKRLTDIHIEGYSAFITLYNNYMSKEVSEDTILKTLGKWGFEISKSMLDLDTEMDSEKRSEELNKALKEIGLSQRKGI